VPWIGYLFDFQHQHLPELFTDVQRLARDRSFEAMARTARYVVVNSQQVRADCLRFLKGRAEFVALPFGAAPRAEWLADAPELLAKYHLPDRYFLVANQFWTHKNHRLVFEALRLLADEPAFRGVQVVCTGSTTDVRDRKYFPSLVQLIHEAKLSERVRILGSIPKRDQVEVVKNAITVVQPTLFEGGPGGGAVYDAVSLGVPALVSDIPVNRELERYEASVRFFDPKDAQGLAGLMAEMAKEPRRARPDRQVLLDQALRRRQAVGEVLWKTIESEIAAYSSVSGK
jgi:glycosyltransferase involved in cell wall biosynthesis